MAGFFRKLFRLTSQANGPTISGDDWSRPSLNDLLERHQVQTRAAAQAAVELPDSNDLEPDVYQNQILAGFDQLCSAKRQDVSASLVILSGMMAKLFTQSVQGIKQQFEIKLRKALATQDIHYKHSLDRLQGQEQAVKLFKSHNRIQHPASYPDSQLWVYFTLFVLVIGESFLNAATFGASQRSFLVGGFGLAMLISIVNVGVGFFLGKYWIRQVFSIHPLWKLIGVVGIAFWLVLLLFFINLPVGHLRYALDAAVGFDIEQIEIYTNAWDSYREAPFGIPDIKSWWLVMFGILANTAALIDGHFSDDYYPGYGAKDRQLSKFRNLFAKDQELLDLREEEITEAALKEGDELIGKYHFDLTTIGRDLAFLSNRIKQDYPQYCKYHAGLYAKVVNAYRDCNRTTRQSPAPKYFDDPVLLESEGLEDLLPGLESLETQYAIKQNEVAAEEQEWNRIRHSDIPKLRIEIHSEIVSNSNNKSFE